MKKQILSIALVFFSLNLFAQVGINNTDPKATLDITASNIANPTTTDGILIPRIDDFPSIDPLAAQDGMMVFVTGNGTPPKGFYYWDGSISYWQSVTGVKYIDELMDGKSDSDGSEDGSSIFLGGSAGKNDDATDNRNIGIGFNSLTSNISGEGNTAIGYNSLKTSLGNNNTAIGYSSLYNNGGGFNTAVGNSSLYNNAGSYNTAVGASALYSNTTGQGNTAIGLYAMFNNDVGQENTAIGDYALIQNKSGEENTAVGAYALSSSTSGGYNTALGMHALNGNTSGNYNTAIGNGALASNSYGEKNVAIGVSSLGACIGYDNIGIGYSALRQNTGGQFNIAIGSEAGLQNGTGLRNIFLGYQSGYNETGSNKLYIENSNADANNALIYGEFNNNLLRVNGNLQVSGVTNLHRNVASGVALQVNGSEALWYNGTYFSWGYGGSANFFADNVGIGITAPNVALDVNGSIEYTGTITDVSDRRLKENFKPINNTLEALQNIKGYTYTMKNDAAKKREYGVIAQDVQKVFPEMVSIIDDEGHFGVSYIQLIPVLVEAIKEQQAEIETLKGKLVKQNQLEERLDKLESLMKSASFTSEIETK
ncbi:tail fiber domain-containing protein [Aequorivita todarodis]|uniref:tail fiber domain-containing protein n=1 Tax=Aequorivita todarodis TaxID=2036821 RepID=UPI00235054E7|nr:tail fiber domain-containing protein [Aequorivita todarodis]MDC8001610.1 tail fiber domain-containing protein [Aequorivita todarodis]